MSLSMKIALIGYGQMGRMVEKVALEHNHEIVARITSQKWDRDALENSDIFIDFTHPESALNNIKKIIPLRKPLIIGTTGWYEHLDILQTLVQQHQSAALYSPNFSIGVQLLYEIIQNASVAMNAFKEYDVAGIEYHHSKKKDSPSGTALEISKIIEGSIERIDKLPFSSVRCGTIPGIHTIFFNSPFDTLTISHEAISREGFARGAILAAEWLLDKKGLYTFKDCMQDMMKKRLPCH